MKCPKCGKQFNSNANRVTCYRCGTSWNTGSTINGSAMVLAGILITPFCPVLGGIVLAGGISVCFLGAK